MTASDGAVDDFLGHTGIAIGNDLVFVGAYGVNGSPGTNSGVEYVFQIPFFIDGFEDGTTDHWDSVTP